MLALSLTQEQQELQERVRTFAAANGAIQIYGSAGYSTEESPVKRYFRNSHATMIYKGTTPFHKMMQAEHALGYRGLIGKPETNR